MHRLHVVESAALVACLLAGGCKSSSGDAVLCPTGVLRCSVATADAIETCALDGKSWVFYQQCPAGQQCNQGVCVAPPPGCDDGTCQGAETCLNCPADCGACCGNGACEPAYNEDNSTCPADCQPAPVPDLGPEPTCGNPSWRTEPLPAALPSGCTLWDIDGTSASDVWILAWCRPDADRVAHYDGTTWRLLPALPDPGGATFPVTIWAAPGGDVWVGFSEVSAVQGSTYRLVRLVGSTWQPVNLPYPVGAVNDIWGSSASDVYVVESAPPTIDDLAEGAIYHYDGGSWTRQLHLTATEFESVHGSSANDVYVLGDALTKTGTGPYYIHTEAKVWRLQGTSWTEIKAFGTDTISRSIRSVGPTSTYVALAAADVFDSGTLHRFDGSSWSTIAANISNEHSPTALWVAAPDEVFLTTDEAIGGTTGNGEVLYRVTNGGAGGSWLKTPLSTYGLDRPRALWGSAVDDVYLAAEQGLMRFGCL